MRHNKNTSPTHKLLEIWLEGTHTFTSLSHTHTERHTRPCLAHSLTRTSARACRRPVKLLCSRVVPPKRHEEAHGCRLQLGTDPAPCGPQHGDRGKKRVLASSCPCLSVLRDQQPEMWFRCMQVGRHPVLHTECLLAPTSVAERGAGWINSITTASWVTVHEV